MMNKQVVKYVLVCLLLAARLPGYAQLNTDLSLSYVEREPKGGSKPAPVIILLHGVGSNERDLFSFEDNLPPGARVISARAPYDLGPDSYGWFHISRLGGKFSYREKEAESSRKLLLKFIDEVKKKYATDAVVLIGFSQGAIMSFSVALTEPGKVKGIAALSGRVLPESKANAAAKERLQKTRVFIGHGSRDSVLPASDGRSAHTFCKELGMAVIYKEYDMAHQISQQEISDLLSWLQATLATK